MGKHSAMWYTNHGLTPSSSLLHREMEEYDLSHGQLFSGASSSRSSLTPVKREPEVFPRLRTVKMEPEAGMELEQQAGGVVGPEDFLPPAKANAFEAAILVRNAREEEEELQRRRREKEINVALYEHGLVKAPSFDGKEEEWRREKKVQEKIYVDLTSNED
ncbi:Alpha-1,4-glucan-protein synthase [Hordeum vulgare]|nr:Alpha-1,4-glucan-protein synthase [Hordeum vulgare]